MINTSHQKVIDQEKIKLLQNHVSQITSDRERLQDQRDELRQELQRLELKAISLERENIQLGEAMANLNRTLDRLLCEGQQQRERLKLYDLTVSELSVIAHQEWTKSLEKVRNELINVKNSRETLRKSTKSSRGKLGETP